MARAVRLRVLEDSVELMVVVEIVAPVHSEPNARCPQVHASARMSARQSANDSASTTRPRPNTKNVLKIRVVVCTGPQLGPAQLASSASTTPAASPIAPTGSAALTVVVEPVGLVLTAVSPTNVVGLC